jgi:transcriptional regulator with XRE-family HTH domain
MALGARIELTDQLRDRIAAARRAKNLSREAMAEQLGVGKMTVVRTELGHRADARKVIRRIELEEIARLTGHSLDYFTGPAATGSQLDRIEQKLDELLSRFGALGTAAPAASAGGALRGRVPGPRVRATSPADPAERATAEEEGQS